MRLLLDEDVPTQFLGPLRQLLPGHQVDHIEDLGWKGKDDLFLLPDARRRQYEVLLTNDCAQLENAEECRAIRDSRLHHVRYHQNTRRGRDGLALAMASVLAAIRAVIQELADVDGQRLVEIDAMEPAQRHQTTDPRIDPPPYWPSRAGHPVRPRRQRGR
ncbi:MAG TPA: hypothetical protein VMU51_20075 [Mycobacteriales bacterium]|nr:hypothetical protein [Mycobacteriales bacterium]